MDCVCILQTKTQRAHFVLSVVITQGLYSQRHSSGERHYLKGFCVQ